MENARKKIGTRIKEIRTSLGLTQEEFAFKLGLNNKSSISQYENGDAIPSDDIKLNICNISDCSMDYLMCKTDIKNSAEANFRFAYHDEIKKAKDEGMTDEEIIDAIRFSIEIKKRRKTEKK